MRSLADGERVRRFLRALGQEADAPARAYLTGGATAVLLGWRSSTIDIDLKIVPESDRLYRAIPTLKESLDVNVELAAPSDFIPTLAEWEARSPLISIEGRLSCHHYDLYSQALAKIERGHAQDLGDVREMLSRGLVERRQLLDFFGQIEPLLYRFPAVDPRAFRRSVKAAVA